MRQVSPTGRSGDSWEVEFDEILLVTDSLGRKNFTYRVTHPRMSETVFYNLVHTEYKRGKYFYTTVKLVRYEMTDEFAGAYARGVKDIAEFTGVIKFNPITDTREPILTIDPPTEPEPEEPVEPPLDPCEDDVVIVVPPPRPDNPNPGPVYIGGGSSGGSSGPGGEPDLSYYFGLPGVQQAGTCFDWLRIPCSEGLHYGEPGCIAEHKGATFLVNSCHGTFTNIYGRDSNPVLIQDPCLPVGSVGVLGPKRDRLNHEKHCAELKKLLDTPNVKAAFTDLAGPKLHDNKEHGYSLRYYPNTDDEHYPTPRPPGTGADNPSITLPVGNNYFGGIHTHYDSDPTLVPMFGGEDVKWFYELIKYFNYSAAETTQDAILPKF